MLVIGASSALAGTSGGNLTCYNYKTVVVRSRASVWIEHNWSSGSKSWYNPYRQLRESYTGEAQTWWGVEWDFEHDGSGAYCTL